MKKVIIAISSTIIFLTVTALLLVGKTKVNLVKDEDSSSKQVTKVNNSEFKLDNIDEKGIVVKLYRSKENKVVELPLEDYVLGVVSAEMPAEFPIEALKAQAVAARTYVLAHMEQFGGVSSQAANGGNVIDTTANQVYYSKEERNAGWPEKKRDEYWNKVTTAVKSTEEEILTYNGALVMKPYFFSTSSGKTENGLDVFDSSEPYLKSVSSTGEESSPKYKNDISISNTEFIKKINASYEGALTSASALKSNIEIVSRGEGGSVKEIKVGKVTMTGAAFRKILGLNSADFEITYSSTALTITTKGYGHGVGMSQFGAKAMAQSGSDYLSILQHYYSGVNIEKIDISNKKLIKIK